MKLKNIPFFGRRTKSLIRQLKLAGYRPDMFDADEALRWNEAKFDFAAARAQLDGALTDLGRRAFDPARDSIHWLLAASIVQRFAPMRILELGTFTGEFTALLSRLYPQAEVVTVDLPDSDPLLQRTYGRKKSTKYEMEIAKRKVNLDHPNIKPVRCNSFFLLDSVEGPFDVVWVDAGHRFPDVAWDLCNAFHLVRRGGIILVDDVTIDPSFRSATLGPDCDIVLRYVAERVPITIRYFLKRRNEEAYLVQKEYVVLCEKPLIWPPDNPSVSPTESVPA